ncbi:uncharacterized protein METZ01_LOCUS279702, partial [marine metagenome]
VTIYTGTSFGFGAAISFLDVPATAP